MGTQLTLQTFLFLYFAPFQMQTKPKSLDNHPSPRVKPTQTR